MILDQHGKPIRRGTAYGFLSAAQKAWTKKTLSKAFSPGPLENMTLNRIWLPASQEKYRKVKTITFRRPNPFRVPEVNE